MVILNPLRTCSAMTLMSKISTSAPSQVARRAKRRLVAALVGVSVGVSAAGMWAWWIPLPVIAAPMTAPPAVVAAPLRTMESTAWTVRLWQPFTDAPVAVAANVVPLKLFSILRRDGAYIAALDSGEGGMTFAKPGDVVHGVTIRSVDAKGIEVHTADGDSRVELER